MKQTSEEFIEDFTVKIEEWAECFPRAYLADTLLYRDEYSRLRMEEVFILAGEFLNA